MYSWGDDYSDWRRPGAYKFDEARKAARKKDARKAKARGPRTYERRGGPDEQITNPRKTIRTESASPLIVAVDVTGSMADWPAEIFDRLPLLYQTLSQYRPDLEISFMAIGDAACSRHPLQVTDFAKGFDLEERLGALWGEGGGGDAPESYELWAWYVRNMVETPNARADGEKPFLILFGDEEFHPTVRPDQVREVIGEELDQEQDATATVAGLLDDWNFVYLLKPRAAKDRVIPAWEEAVGSQRIVEIHDELRAVDYAMGLVARTWGHGADFRENMEARQDEEQVEKVENSLAYVVLEEEEDGIPPTRRHD